MSVFLWIFDGDILGAGLNAKAAEDRGLAVLATWAEVFAGPNGAKPSPEDVAERLAYVKQRGELVQYNLASVNGTKPGATDGAGKRKIDSAVVQAVLGLLPQPDEVDENEPDESNDAARPTTMPPANGAPSVSAVEAAGGVQ